ncbi:hypothetical protein KCU89_g15854, partial [Aureobasidium melanogenum]
RNRRPRSERNPNPPTQQDEPQSDAPNPARRRRGGGGRGRGARDPLLALRPSSVTPSTQPSSIEPSSADVSATEATTTNQDSRRSRGGVRGGRGGARGARARAENRTVNGRAFGGQLTSDGELQADATTFVPGQPILNQGATSQQTQPRSQRRRLSKSTAPDIATRTHHDIDNGHYECPICTSEVLRNSKDLPLLSSKVERMAKYPLLDNGDALDVTFRKTPYPRRTLAGARKKLSRAQSLVCLLILAETLVVEKESANVLILVN